MRKRALVFDDDEGIRRLVSLVLLQGGYEVFEFPNPGLCLLHGDGPCSCPEGHACAHVIISDLQMPVVQGLDFIEELRQKQCRCPSFALMSGSWSPEDMHRAHDLGCQLFSKPFTVPMLKNWLETVEHRASSLPELTDWDVPGSGSASDS